MSRRPALSPAKERQLVTKYDKAKRKPPLRKFAEEYGVDISTVCRILDRHGVERKRNLRTNGWTIEQGIPPTDSRDVGDLKRARVKSPLHKKQKGRCAVCRTKIPLTNTVVDHCHTTGKIRGALCTQCNVGLGMFRDDVTILVNAIAYLQNEESP